MTTDRDGNRILSSRRFMPAQEPLSPFYYIGEPFGLTAETAQADTCTQQEPKQKQYVTKQSN